MFSRKRLWLTGSALAVAGVLLIVGKPLYLVMSAWLGDRHDQTPQPVGPRHAVESQLLGGRLPQRQLSRLAMPETADRVDGGVASPDEGRRHDRALQPHGKRRAVLARPGGLWPVRHHSRRRAARG